MVEYSTELHADTMALLASLHKYNDFLLRELEKLQ
jgi:hypothetical protein